MAGYIMALGDKNSLITCIENGVYGTILSFEGENGEQKEWSDPKRSTLADYATMKAGDKIYFFIDKKIHGVGELVNINNECVFFNYPNAHLPDITEEKYSKIKDKLLFNTGSDSGKIRVICTFKPSPLFFMDGIDMDEALNSNPLAFKMLRAFEGVSFIKVDDEENRALFGALLKLNEENYSKKTNVYPDKSVQAHNKIKSLVNANYKFNPLKIIKNEINREKELELLFLHQYSKRDSDIHKAFGEWDYLSHQVIASPFKPIKWVKRMDIFGYSYIKGLEESIINNYLVIELKKGNASKKDLYQLLRYVDFTNKEYCSDNYKMIKAFLVAEDFTHDVISRKSIEAKRMFSYKTEDSEPQIWDNLKLIQYSFINGKLRFQEIK